MKPKPKKRKQRTEILDNYFSNHWFNYIYSAIVFANFSLFLYVNRKHQVKFFRILVLWYYGIMVLGIFLVKDKDVILLLWMILSIVFLFLLNSSPF